MTDVITKKSRKIILIAVFALIFSLFALLVIARGKDGENTAPSTESPQAKPTPVPFGEVRYEDNSKAAFSLTGTDRSLRYMNSCSLSCTMANGGELYVGSSGSGETGALILNPVYRRDSSTSEYAAYVSCSDAEVSYREDSSSECRIFTGRTYDTALPCSAVTVSFPDASDKDHVIGIRVVRLSDFMVVGTARCVARCKDGRCSLVSLERTDVEKSYGSCEDSLREELVCKAADYIADDSCGPVLSTVNREYLDSMKEFAVVEKVALPYFGRLCASDGSCISAGSLSGMELYAVNICYLGTGNITVYLAPELQTRGYGISETFFSPGKNYRAFAYDFLYPFTSETILIPDDAYENADFPESVL